LILFLAIIKAPNEFGFLMPILDILVCCTPVMAKLKPVHEGIGISSTAQGSWGGGGCGIKASSSGKLVLEADGGGRVEGAGAEGRSMLEGENDVGDRLDKVWGAGAEGRSMLEGENGKGGRRKAEGEGGGGGKALGSFGANGKGGMSVMSEGGGGNGCRSSEYLEAGSDVDTSVHGKILEFSSDAILSSLVLFN
jgi:hypothetical protein